MKQKKDRFFKRSFSWEFLVFLDIRILDFRLVQLCLYRLDNGHNIRKRNARDHKEGVMDYVHKPAVIFGEEGQAVLRGIDNVHEIDIRNAVVQNAVDIESKEHQNEQKL